MRHVHEAVTLVDAYGVCVTRCWNHLQRLADASIRSDGIDAHEIRAIRSAEQITSAAIERDIWKALRERTGAHELERAARTVDAVGVRRKRLRAHGSDEKTLVRTDGHRHDEVLGLETLAGAKRAVRLHRI